jgi:hypothetical protein
LKLALAVVCYKPFEFNHNHDMVVYIDQILKRFGIKVFVRVQLILCPFSMAQCFQHVLIMTNHVRVLIINMSPPFVSDVDRISLTILNVFSSHISTLGCSHRNIISHEHIRNVFSPLALARLLLFALHFCIAILLPFIFLQTSHTVERTILRTARN